MCTGFSVDCHVYLDENVGGMIMSLQAVHQRRLSKVTTTGYCNWEIGQGNGKLYLSWTSMK